MSVEVEVMVGDSRVLLSCMLSGSLLPTLDVAPCMLLAVRVDEGDCLEVGMCGPPLKLLKLVSLILMINLVGRW